MRLSGTGQRGARWRLFWRADVDLCSSALERSILFESETGNVPESRVNEMQIDTMVGSQARRKTRPPNFRLAATVFARAHTQHARTRARDDACARSGFVSPSRALSGHWRSREPSQGACFAQQTTPYRVTDRQKNSPRARRPRVPTQGLWRRSLLTLEVDGQ